MSACVASGPDAAPAARTAGPSLPAVDVGAQRRARFADVAVATLTFVALNVATFAVTHNFLDVATLTGESLRHGALQDGALFAPYIDGRGEWWRIVTGTFLHANLAHLVFNMFLLYLLGRRIEGYAGPSVLVGTYLVSMLGGSAGALLASPLAATIGASGAVFGLLGCAFVVEFRSGSNPWRDGLGSLIVVNVVVSFLIPNVSVGGHIGGLVAGALAALAVGDLRRYRHWLVVWGLFAVIGAAAAAFAVWAAGTWVEPVF